MWATHYARGIPDGLVESLDLFAPFVASLEQEGGGNASAAGAKETERFFQECLGQT